MSGSVSHIGTVLKITPSLTSVSIEQHSACSQCHAAGLCGLSDVVEKAVEVPTDPYLNIAPGDKVQVLLKATMGMKAVWLAYFIPLVVLLGTVLLLYYLGAGEVPSGLAGLGATGLYYFLLWLFRDKLRNEYIFTIKEL